MAVRVRTLRVASVVLQHKLVRSVNVLKGFSALAKGWSLDVVTLSVCFSSVQGCVSQSVMYAYSGSSERQCV